MTGRTASLSTDETLDRPAINDSSFLTSTMGIVQITSPNGDHFFGMGILISPRLIVTCAHVVNLALNRDIWQKSPLPKGSTVTVLFPFVDARPRQKGSVVEWRQPGSSPLDDLALLRLDADAPEDARIAILADIRSLTLDRDPLSVFGVQPGRTLGQSIEAEFIGRANAAWVEIGAVKTNGPFIAEGYSGAGVWDHVHGATIGMIVARHADPNLHVAYMVPTEQIVKFLPEIPHETRETGSVFAAMWTFFAPLMLVVIVCHMLADRIAEFPKYLSLGLGSRALTCFFGMHITLVMAAILLSWMSTFAQSFSEHPWWMRIPKFGRIDSPAQPSATAGAAIAAILLFVAAPLWCQGHFLKRFHELDLGQVYVDPQAFGYGAGGSLSQQEFCADPTRASSSAKFCADTFQGRYATVKPKPPSQGEYLCDAYRFGGPDRDGHLNSVTFWPIAQPAAIILLTGLLYAYAGLTLWRIFQPAHRANIFRAAQTADLPTSG